MSLQFLILYVNSMAIFITAIWKNWKQNKQIRDKMYISKQCAQNLP